MEIKDKILNSAIKLFAAKGFEGVSIREIAKAADVHFAGIRYHFGDKKSLYKKCITKHGESRLLSAQKFLNLEPQNAEEMKKFLFLAIEDVFSLHRQNPHLTKLILREIELSNGRSDPILKRTIVAMTEVYRDYFIRCIDKKLLKKNLDPTFMAHSLMGILHHFMRTENIRERLLKQQTLKDKEIQIGLIHQIVNLYLTNEESL